MILCVLATFFIPRGENAVKSAIQEQIEAQPVQQQTIPTFPTNPGAGENAQETGAALAVEAQIVAKEPIAQKAIPNCNITYIDKAEMKQALSGYLDVLFHQDSLSIGGGLPESDFYYDAE